MLYNLLKTDFLLKGGVIMKKVLAIILLSLLSIVSCTTAADGTRKVSKTGVGAGIGAAAGAVIGQAIRIKRQIERNWCRSKKNW